MTQNASLKDLFKQIQVIHLALCLGLILMLLAFSFVFGIELEMNFELNMLVIVGIAIMVSAITFSNFFKNQNKSTSSGKEGIEEKLNQYKSKSLIRWALLEGATILNIILYFIVEPNIISLILFFVGLLFLLQARPNLNEFADAYNLSEQEKAVLL